jgi:PKD repeat protein
VIHFLTRALTFLVTLLLVSCPTGSEIKVNHPPILQELKFNTSSGVSPLNVQFSWLAVTDPDGDGFSCDFDTNSDGTFEFPNFDCSSITSQNFTYQNVGNFVAKLVVTDSKGAATVHTIPINVVVAGLFSIELRFATGFPDKFKPAFQAAATRWQNIITADIPDSTSTFLPSKCGVTGQTSVVGVDDLVIWVNTIAFDAQNPNLLGRAGPCYFRPTTFFTVVGSMEFVDTQMNGLLAANQLTDTVMHEMGHILGLGTHWQSLGLAANVLGGSLCGTDPQYIGANALREYRTLGGIGNIKLENLYGPGTCEGHWKESVFGTELMTGFLNGGVANPLSRMTLASMQDLGYNIDLSKADPYTIPKVGTALVRSGKTLIVTRPVDQVIP